MERRGPKARKTEHNVEEENKDETPIPESGNANTERKTPSTKDDTAEKVDDPLNNPQLKEDKAGREQRKRHASEPDVAPPKKPAPLLITEQAAAETDQSSVDDVLMLEVENLTIDQSRRDYKLEGARPRPQPEVLVSRERSGYWIAQASFLDPSSESVPSGSSVGEPDESVSGVSGSGVAGVPGSDVASARGSDVAGAPGSDVAGASGSDVAGASGSGFADASGSGVAGVSGSSGAAVPTIKIGDDVPILTINVAEERYARIIAKYNDLIPSIAHQITSYRNVVEQAIPRLIQNTRFCNNVLLFCRENTPELDSACFLGCFDLECIEEDLPKYTDQLKEHTEECTTIAENIMRIYSADNTLPRSNLLDEEVYRLLKKLEVGLDYVSRFVDKCNNEVSRYDGLRFELDHRFPGVGNI